MIFYKLLLLLILNKIHLLIGVYPQTRHLVHDQYSYPLLHRASPLIFFNETFTFRRSATLLSVVLPMQVRVCGDKPTYEEDVEVTLLEYKSLSGNISTIGRGRFSAIVPYGSLKTIELKGLSQGPPYVQATFMTYKMLIHFTKGGLYPWFEKRSFSSSYVFGRSSDSPGIILGFEYTAQEPEEEEQTLLTKITSPPEGSSSNDSASMSPAFKQTKRNFTLEYDLDAFIQDNPPKTSRFTTNPLNASSISSNPNSVVYNTYGDLIDTFSSKVRITPLGLSPLRRPIQLFRVSQPQLTEPQLLPTNNKKIALIVGGVAASELQAPYLLFEFMRRLLTECRYKMPLLTHLDWALLPLLNPDGFAYVANTKDPFSNIWSKNRTPINGSHCFGINIDRNWAFHWAESEDEWDPCSDTYGGPRPWSAREAVLLRDWLLSNSGRVALLIQLDLSTKYNHLPVIQTPWLFTNAISREDLSASWASRVSAPLTSDPNPRSPLPVASGTLADWAAGPGQVDYVFRVNPGPTRNQSQLDQTTDRFCLIVRQLTMQYLLTPSEQRVPRLN